MAVACQAFDVVERAEGQEMVHTAGEVLASLAGADEDAAVSACGRLANLHVKGFTVQRNFS